MKKFFILNDVMNNKLRIKNLVFLQGCCSRFKYYGMLCCLLLDAGDSSTMGCYVVYCLIPKKRAGISFETSGIIYPVINIYYYLLIIE